MSQKRKKPAPKERSAKVIPLRPRQPSAKPPADIPPTSAYHAWIVRREDDARLLVDYEGNPGGPVPARSVVRFTPRELDAMILTRSPVLITFYGDASDQVAVIGLAQPVPPSSFVTDDKLELRCGEGSISITSDGKVMVRGTHVSIDSDAVVRIRGGSVDIN